MALRSQRVRALLFGSFGALTLTLAATTAVAAGGPPPPTVLIRDGQAGFDHATPLVTPPVYPPYESDTAVEPSIASNPANALNAVAVYQQGRDPNGGSADIGFATTTDGGQHWVSGNLPGVTDVVTPGVVYNHASDPVVTFGPNNLVYANYLELNESLDAQGTVNGAGLGVSVSKDGGLTWGTPVVMQLNNAQEVQEIGFFDDKNWITVDNSNAAGHHLGRVYVVWDIQEIALYAYCDPDRAGALTPGCDQLSNWTTSDPVGITNSGFYSAYPSPAIGSYPIILQSGALMDIFNDEGASPCTLSSTPFFGEVTSTTPGGDVVWPAPLTFPACDTQVAADDANGVPLQRAGPDLPTAAIDPVSGRVAIGWAGGSSRSDGRNDPEVAISTDNTGSSWGSPIRIDQGAPTGDYVDRYNTMIGFGPDGSLRAGYRQRQEAASAASMSPIVDTYYQVSYDFGSSWSTPLKVDTQNTDVGWCAFSRGGCFLGDYNELAPAGPDTYIVREEAFADPSDPSETPFNTGSPPCFCPTGYTGQGTHQTTWVALVGPQQNQPNIPETPWVAGLALAGTASAAMIGVARRRRMRAPGV
jgi:hypothetical protein